MSERRPAYVIEETLRQYRIPASLREEIVERVEVERVLRLEIEHLRRRVAQLEPHVPEEVRHPPVAAASYVRRGNE